MSDLLSFFAINDNDEPITSRHTQNTRRRETYVKKNRLILERMKGSTLIGNRVVQEIETDLSDCNKKTLSFESFKWYIRRKMAMVNLLGAFYEKACFRRQKMTQHIRRQVTDARMLNNFKATFHPNVPSRNVIIAWGDWSQKKHRKFNEPVKGVGFRKTFRRAGYNVLLVDEYRTSKKCSICQDPNAECETFRMINNPRPYRQGRIKCHGLLRCTTCKRLWNRDLNAAKNIWNIARAAMDGSDRPSYLQRGDAGRAGAVPVPVDVDVDVMEVDPPV